MPRRHAAEVDLALRDGQVPEDFFGGPQTPQKIAADKARLTLSDGGTVVLLGGAGTGKTRMAAWLAGWFANTLQTPLYVVANDLMDELHEAMLSGKPRSGRYRFEFDRYNVQSPHLLIIDEVQALRASEDVRRKLEAIIDQRYREMAATLLIANCERAKLGDALGPNIVRRVQDAGRVIECDWPRYREGGAA